MNGKEALDLHAVAMVTAKLEPEPLPGVRKTVAYCKEPRMVHNVVQPLWRCASCGWHFRYD